VVKEIAMADRGIASFRDAMSVVSEGEGWQDSYLVRISVGRGGREGGCWCFASCRFQSDAMLIRKQVWLVQMATQV